MARLHLRLDRLASAALRRSSAALRLRPQAPTGAAALVLVSCALLGLLAASLLLSLVVPATVGHVSRHAAAGLAAGGVLAGVLLGAAAVRRARRP